MKKKMALLILLGVSLLVGCEDETATLNNVEFISATESRGELAALFKTENDSAKILYIRSTNLAFELDEGSKYNVTFTVQYMLEDGDVLQTVELVKE